MTSEHLLASSNTLGPAVAEALGIDASKCTRLSIHLEPDCAVKVRAEFLADDADAQRLIGVLSTVGKSYELIERRAAGMG